MSALKGKLAVPDAIHGKSAYEIAVMNGFDGTEEKWLESLAGKNAYEYAKDGGYAGTEEEFANSLVKGDEHTETLANHERRIKSLESGVIAGFETDTTAAYQKTVPANALLYAELEKSGVFTKKVKSTNLLPVNEYTLYAPYEVGVKKEICTVKLPAGMYYISFMGGYSGGYMTSDEIARIMINDVDSRYITLDTAQTVTVYAVMYQDDSANGSDFEQHSFNDIGIFAVSFEGEVPSYEKYVEPGIVNVPLTAIESNGNTYTIPASMVELQETMVSGEGCYGYDYIDWANKKLYKCMGAVDMGSLAWKLSNGRFYASVSDMKSSSSSNVGIMCLKYTYNGVSTSSLVEGGIVNVRTNVYVKDSFYTTEEDFKAAVTGTMLYYELAEPEVIDIDIDGFDRFIEVSPGGKITFKNAYNSAIPSTITYQMKGV